MLDIQVIKNKLRYARMTSHWQDVDDVLAELEKPAEDVELDDAVSNIISSAWDWEVGTDYVESILRKYAESYHAKKCAECKHTVWCATCGDPITIGVCENCVPDMFSDDNTPKTETPRA